MNRIVIIGNGFDLAHGLKTGYKDFIDSYLEKVFNSVFSPYSQELFKNYRSRPIVQKYKDEFWEITPQIYRGESMPSISLNQKETPFATLCEKFDQYGIISGSYSFYTKYKNDFFRHISAQCALTNWVDIENEYYNELKRISLEAKIQERSKKVRRLNDDFNAVKKKLEEYLSKISKTSVSQKESIKNAIDSLIKLNDIAIGKKHRFRGLIHETGLLVHLSKDESYNPTNTIFLNFNYTNTAEKLYLDKGVRHQIINIHGELNSGENPIIFGYGDELDSEYKKIEELQDNDFLENMKSINYHQTKNYRSLLEHLNSSLYQVFIMGHSCGNSDRTLLNTIFEHDNCLSIKAFYHQKDDNTDNYADLIKNISRNFNNKQNMRDIVVNKEYCSPLVPIPGN